MTNAILREKPDARNPHVRFDEGEVASGRPRRGSLLYYKSVIFLLTGTLSLYAIENVESFVDAKPIWTESDLSRMNATVAFRTVFDGNGVRKVRIAAASCYRAWLNGRFLAYGPNRAPRGCFRVDELPLAGRIQDGTNVLTVEVAGYNCANFCWVRQPPMLQAEILAADGRVIAATGRNEDFEATLAPRVSRCPRLVLQRTFEEAYRVDGSYAAWLKGVGSLPRRKIVVSSGGRLLPRLAPYPEYCQRPLSPCGVSKFAKGQVEKRKFGPDPFGAYSGGEIEVDVTAEFGACHNEPIVWSSYQLPAELVANQEQVLRLPSNDTGFLRIEVDCLRPGRLLVAHDESLSGNRVNPFRLRPGVAFGEIWEVKSPGRYVLETFEPHTFQFVSVKSDGGDFRLLSASIREYVNPEPFRSRFHCSDDSLNKVFDAAVRSIAQNTMDAVMDCPSRERASWLCDGRWICRAVSELSGNDAIENLFWDNFIQDGSHAEIPKDVMPMLCPGDFPDGIYLPAWSLWGAIQLADFAERGGRPEFVRGMREKILAAIKFHLRYLNGDGLLETQPGWRFVSWDRANANVKGVNFCLSLLLAGALEAADRIYGIPDYARRAAEIRTTVRRQSYRNGRFHDHAVRFVDGQETPVVKGTFGESLGATPMPVGDMRGELRLADAATETAQVYAFFFGAADRARDTVLWKDLLTGESSLDKAALYLGGVMRGELFERYGLWQVLLNDARKNLLPMAERTGTLWEHYYDPKGPDRASRCHGYPCVYALWIMKAALGIEKLDRVRKTVTFRQDFGGEDLEFAQGVLPTQEGELAVSWRKVDGRIERETKLPKNWIESR